MKMIPILLALLLFALLCDGFERFNGQKLEGSRVNCCDCFELTLKNMGSPAKGLMDAYYALGIEIKNTSKDPCRIDPFEFRLVDHNGKQHDVKKVGKLGPRKKGETALILPGATKLCNLFLDKIELDPTKPTVLYYRNARLGEFTK